ncbi:MAG: hypothetical protein VYB90_20220 [Actinomycetota bacterium]|nr:hypothetical protein [Actinomycetota bacterium]
MGTSEEPIILAEYGGLVIAERGPEVILVDRGSGPTEIVVFVLVVVTMVFGGFGAVSVWSAAAGGMSAGSAWLGVALLAVAAAAATAMYVSVNALRRRRGRPLTSFTPVAVFDRAARVYRDGTGAEVAPVDQVRFERRMHMTSSSPKLVAVTPNGTRVLKRGNPFGGGIGDLDAVLTRVVHGAPH